MCIQIEKQLKYVDMEENTLVFSNAISGRLIDMVHRKQLKPKILTLCTYKNQLTYGLCNYKICCLTSQPKHMHPIPTTRPLDKSE